MAFIVLILLTALAISGTAAYFSVAGLAALFPATALAVIIMGSVLEVGKIVSVKWLHANWKNPSSRKSFKWLMCAFTLPLLLITNLGIYGFLSKGHLEQNAPVAGQEIQIAQIEQQIKQRQDDVARQQKRLDQISKVTDTVLAGNARAGLRASNQSKREAQAITKTIDEDNQAINDLNTKLVPLKVANSEVEAKLGPIKYVASALAIKDPEAAVRIVIALIMSGFDTLALCLFIAFSISLKDHQQRKKLVEEDTGWNPDITPLTPEQSAHLDEHLFDAPDPEPQPEPVVIETLAEHVQDIIQDSKEPQEPKVDYEALMVEAQEALNKEKAEFEEARAQLEQKFIREAADMDTRQAQLDQDTTQLQNAHQQLLDMEERINDERELLKQWEEQLVQQQNAINNWSPEDTRSDKEKIIEMLEKNPEVVNEIVNVVDALRPRFVKPGL